MSEQPTTEGQTESYCHIHDVFEPFGVWSCFECGHEYQTFDELLEQYRTLPTPATATLADVLFCPWCLHDFPISVPEEEQQTSARLEEQIYGWPTEQPND
jgi:hypothetical protein